MQCHARQIRNPLRAVAAALPLLLVAQLQADVSLAPIFGDSMVLQRETEVPIWGWAEPGEIVKVRGSWNADVAEAKVDARGKWQATLRTGPAGGPYTLTVTGVRTITIEDVLLGEVWLCSGQSNMEMPVANVSGYSGVLRQDDEIASADHREIRLLTVPNTVSLHPSADLGLRWQVCSPETVQSFSATGYFFGRELQQQLGVPIGLIDADWGGTRIEAWMSDEALAPFGAYDAELDHLRHMADPAGRASLTSDLETQWWGSLDSKAHIDAAWNRPDFDDSKWGQMSVPGHFSADLTDFDGTVYMRRTFTLARDPAEGDIMLELGPIDDMDDVWINGKPVGSTHDAGSWNQPRHYKLPPDSMHQGQNVIAIRVLDTGGPGGLFGDANQIKLITGAGPTPLAGTWRVARGASMADLPPRASSQIGPNSVTALYHAMIEPVAPYAIRGAIWYQGESNRNVADRYDDLMRAMIADWRSLWGRDIWFDYVQIAPFTYGGDNGETAELRDAQRRAMDVPRTGMVVTMDIGDLADIHPKNKQEVGRRLALWALNRTYDRIDLVCSGPIYRSFQVEGDSIRIHFDHTEGGLNVPDGTLDLFTIAGPDGNFQPATATIEADTIVVHSDHVPKPAHVRYAWDDAIEGELFNGAGLPATPFTTEDDD